MKRTRRNLVVSVNPLTAAEKKKVYLMTGKLLKMNNIVAQRHYKQMVEYVDDDMVTMPSHKHLMRLYIKYGLFEPIE
jgi:HKD family nuclease